MSDNTTKERYLLSLNLLYSVCSITPQNKDIQQVLTTAYNVSDNTTRQRQRFSLDLSHVQHQKNHVPDNDTKERKKFLARYGVGFVGEPSYIVTRKKKINFDWITPKNINFQSCYIDHCLTFWHPNFTFKF